MRSINLELAILFATGCNVFKDLDTQANFDNDFSMSPLTNEPKFNIL